jgi:predicted GH43/DUF377 family glycosyl hydrolase
MRFSVGPFTAQVLKIKTSAAEGEPTIWYPASTKHPARTSPSAKFVEQPKLLTKTFIAFHRNTLNALKRNKNIEVAISQNLQKFETFSNNAYKE